MEGSELIRHDVDNKLFYSELPRDRRGRYRDQNGAVQVVSTVLVRFPTKLRISKCKNLYFLL